MVKRHPKYPSGYSLVQEKREAITKPPIKQFASRFASHFVFHPSYLSSVSPQSDEHDDSSEPEVLDLSLNSKHSHRTPREFLYASSLQSLLQVIPPIPSSTALPTPITLSTSVHAKFARQQENLSKNPTIPSVKKTQSSNKRKSSSSIAKPTSKKTKSSLFKKLGFDEYKSSPVSGTFILDSDAEDDEVAANMGIIRRNGDIDPSLNVVIETEEAREELSKIENKIGDYNCCLCRQQFTDAFRLASHRCPRIVHIEYRCTECEKVFNCPANLASHRRWHKPRDSMNNKKTTAPLSDCEAEQSPPFIGRD